MFRQFLRSKKSGPAKRPVDPVFVHLTEADLIDMGIKRYQLERSSSRS